LPAAAGAIKARGKTRDRRRISRVEWLISSRRFPAGASENERNP
jgi:hypothetical protein